VKESRERTGPGILPRGLGIVLAEEEFVGEGEHAEEERVFAVRTNDRARKTS
jgi:hypothetical protein